MGLSKDDILAADDLNTTVVEVPAWGGEVGIREMTGAERDDFEADIMERRADGDMEVDLRMIRVKLLVRTLVDPDTDERLFEDDEMADLAGKSGAVLGRLFEDARQLNGFTASDMEDLAGN